MSELPDKLTNEQVSDLAEAGLVEYRRLGNDYKFFVIINGDLYKKGGSYDILKRDFSEYEARINKRLEVNKNEWYIW